MIAGEKTVRETAILYTGKDHLTARETVDAWLRKEI